MRFSDWSSDVCASDLVPPHQPVRVAADQVAEERAVPGAHDMNGIDDARHRRAVAFDRGNDIVQLVRGRIEAFERLAAVRPFGGGYRRDELSDRALVHVDLDSKSVVEGKDELVMLSIGVRRI